MEALKTIGTEPARDVMAQVVLDNLEGASLFLKEKIKRSQHKEVSL